MTMQHMRKANMIYLSQNLDFNMHDIIQDLFQLLKVSKNEQTCEQALALLRTFVADEQKLHYLIGLKSLSELPEEADVENTVPSWLKDSFSHRLTQQLINVEMSVKKRDEIIEEAGEKSAFDVDMDDQEANEDSANKKKTAYKPDQFEVTHTSGSAVAEVDVVIPLEMLLIPRVQIAAVRLLHAVFTFERYLERNRLGAEEKRIVAGVLQLRRLSRKLVSDDTIVPCAQAHVFKLHPLTQVILLDVVFEDVYL